MKKDHTVTKKDQIDFPVERETVTEEDLTVSKKDQSVTKKDHNHFSEGRGTVSRKKPNRKQKKT